jgi:purine-binding chemotaxis protein CheW
MSSDVTQSSTTAPAPPAPAVPPAPRRDLDGAGGGYSTSQRYLTFTLRDEVYALDILEVTEIIEFRALTVVPMMPSFIRGVINLRGRVLPVLDLAARFGQGSTEVSKRTGIIVVGTGIGAGGSGEDSPSGIGVMVDAVNKVVHLAGEDIEPPPAFGAGIRPDFIRGMAKLDGQFVVLLDVANVLSVAEMVQIGHAAVQGTTASPVDMPSE